GADVLVCFKGGNAKASALIVLELKKTAELCQQSINEHYVQLLAANEHSYPPVIAVLTDLKDYWSFSWLCSPPDFEKMGFLVQNVTDRRQGLGFLNWHLDRVQAYESTLIKTFQETAQDDFPPSGPPGDRGEPPDPDSRRDYDAIRRRLPTYTCRNLSVLHSQRMRNMRQHHGDSGARDGADDELVARLLRLSDEERIELTLRNFAKSSIWINSGGEEFLKFEESRSPSPVPLDVARKRTTDWVEST
ncbi:hypothetical protein HK405_001368, partial [Cladochytrium tenue]